MNTFTAVDFETMTPARTSACAIGLVKVVNNVITEKFYSLIKPIPDNHTILNTDIHGIDMDMVANAPTIAELWPRITDFIGDNLIVCHNRSMDICVFDACMEHYNLNGLNTCNNACTYAMTKAKLTECCKQHNIPFSAHDHHDALADADACAKVFMALNGFTQKAKPSGRPSRADFASFKERRIDSDTLKPLCADEVENKDTPFYCKKVVITGTFERYPVRKELAATLKALGADIDTAISKRTNIVIAGKGAGPKKMEKIKKLQEAGSDIVMISEEEVAAILGH